MKKTICFILLFCVFSINTINVYGTSADIVTFNTKASDYSSYSSYNKSSKLSFDIYEDEINEYNNNVEVNGVLPIINTNKDSINSRLNKAISKDYEEKLGDIKKTNSKKLEFDYEVFENDDIYSIVVEYKDVNLTTKSYVKTYNINKSGKFLDIYDVLGEYASQILTKLINDNHLKDDYSEKIEVDETLNFYFDDETLNIVFDSGVLNDIHEGIYTIEIEAEDIKTKKIYNKEYYTDSPFNVKMVNIKGVIEDFDFDFEKVSESEFIISSDDIESRIYIEHTEDNYYKNKKVVNLEAKPMIKNDELYVPIAYLSNVLDLVYFVDEDDDIIVVSVR